MTAGNPISDRLARATGPANEDEEPFHEGDDEIADHQLAYMADMILELQHMAQKAGDAPLTAQLMAAYVTATRPRGT